MNDENAIWIISSEAVRGRRAPRKLALEDLSANVNRLLGQVEVMLSKVPEGLGGFRLDEFEFHAEVTAKGTLALLGTGGEVGASGGLKFVFRRAK